MGVLQHAQTGKSQGMNTMRNLYQIDDARNRHYAAMLEQHKAHKQGGLFRGIGASMAGFMTMGPAGLLMGAPDLAAGLS